MQPNLDLTFRALADPTRRDVIRVLRKGPRRASDLADALGASRPAMSRHLRVLRTAGLVNAAVGGEPAAGVPTSGARGATDDDEADARERIYTLAPRPFEQLRTWLEEVEQFWGLQLEAFKDHVERTRGKKR